MDLASLTRGDGPLRIALVHGLGVDSTTWIPFADELLAHVDATVIAPDLRGHGESERAEEYTVAAMAQDLVDTLPPDLDVVIGHSLGGAVLERAIGRLDARRAVYIDPGFQLALRTTGVAGRFFWAASPLTLRLASLLTARANRATRESYPEASRELAVAAQQRFDRRMAPAIFRDLAFHPVRAAAPTVASTILLTAQSAAVLPARLVTDLRSWGWDIRTLPHARHDVQLQDPAATYRALADVLDAEPDRPEHERPTEQQALEDER